MEGRKGILKKVAIPRAVSVIRKYEKWGDGEKRKMKKEVTNSARTRGEWKACEIMSEEFQDSRTRKKGILQNDYEGGKRSQTQIP